MAAAAMPGVESNPMDVRPGVHLRPEVLREVVECPPADSAPFRCERMKIYGHMGMKQI